MNKSIVILILLSLATGLFAQQSNKSKSKDRYREKDMPSRSDVNELIDQYGTLRSLAEQQFRPTTFALSQVMSQSQLSAPVASRTLAYSMLAAYETTARYQSKVSTLHDVLRDMPMMLSFAPADSVFYPFASLYAMLETGRQMLPAGYMLQQQQAALEQLFRQNGLREAFIGHSKRAAADISRLIVNYAATDGYARLAAYPAYQAENAPGTWSPQGKVAVEPYWAYLRPFFLESSGQFANPNPVPYDVNAGSVFRSYTQEVYEISRTMVPEQYAVAYFWACDPEASQAGISKISAAGRWMNIAGLACEQQKIPFIATLKIHTVLALGMADAVMASWNEKYRTKRIRPQTAINQMLDASWKPVLEAPACPAGSSMQSAVSATAAEILSRMLGENIAITDNTEAVYGIPNRQYPSIRHAAEEAAWSRLYGGVAFRDGILSGQQTGKQVGLLALQKWPAGL